MPSETLELSMTRLIDAPVETAWNVATEWLGGMVVPKPWTVEIVEHAAAKLTAY